MKTCQILCENTGENAGTYDPMAEYVPGSVDINETVNRCVSFDFDQLVEVPKYKVAEISLPDWLSVSEWLSRQIKWRFFWGNGGDKSWPESWQRGLLEMDEVIQYTLIKLLKTKNFRSSFRKSMCELVIIWLEINPSERQYNKPLSPKQMECLFDKHTVREARSISEKIYWNKNII